MPGPAPKDRDARRRANAPAGGEWITLPQLAEPVLPKLPTRPRRDGSWSARTKATWEAWRQDPATGMYGPSEVAGAIDLLWLFEANVREPKSALASEIRHRMDGLGLTPKGKKDLRWRVADQLDQEPQAPERKAATVTRLRAV